MILMEPTPQRTLELPLVNSSASYDRQRHRRHYDARPSRAYRPPLELSRVRVDVSKARTNVDVVRDVIKELNMIEVPQGDNSDIYWHGSSFTDNPYIKEGKVNKFPGMNEMTRKVALCQALNMLKTLFPEEYHFYPRTWFLPDQLEKFQSDITLAAQKRPSRKMTFIVKPSHGSQGDGIYLVNSPDDLVASDRAQVVQEYMPRPLIVDNYKFDLRIYAVLLNLEPLQIYISKEGMARFCTVAYQAPTGDNINLVYMHLTNYSLNKKSSTYEFAEIGDKGSKRTVSSVFKHLREAGKDTDALWNDIEKLICKTIFALLPQLKLDYYSDVSHAKPKLSCFQILGFDILVKENLQPMLLEVNGNPSLRIDYDQAAAPDGDVPQSIPSPVDQAIKRPIVRDTLIIGTREFRSSSSPGGRRDENDNPARSPSSSTSSQVLSVLEEVYPAKYAAELDRLRSVERISALFQYFASRGSSMRLGCNGFKSFISKSNLVSDMLGHSSVDSLYAEFQQKWGNDTTEQSGLSFRGFVKAFFVLARRKFSLVPLNAAVERLLDFCDEQLAYHGRRHKPKRVLPRIESQQRTHPTNNNNNNNNSSSALSVQTTQSQLSRNKADSERLDLLRHAYLSKRSSKQVIWK